MKTPPPPPLESDARFPSGPWVGFWMQRMFAQRQWMDLLLTFSDGVITGEGRDFVGEFIMKGRYSVADGKCTIHKHYLNQHVVTYTGVNEGPKLWLWGIWTIGQSDRGGFHIWPKGEPDPTDAAAQELEIPVEPESPVLAPLPSI